MPALPADLVGPLCSVDIDLAATARLLAVFHRNLARRLVDSLEAGPGPAAGVDADPAATRKLWREVRRLPPRLVHRGYAVSAHSPEADAACGPDALRDALGAAAAVPGAAGVYQGDAEVWARDGLRRAVGALGWGEPDAARIVSDIPADVTSALALSREALAEVWPEAWAEHNQIVDTLVFAEGPLRSATTQSTFGALYISVEEAHDPVRLFEVLLHETGHHALALRCQFTRFLENPDAVSAHPLRSDPRPLFGVLHAAFVLARIATGLRRYAAVFPVGGPLDGDLVRERLTANIASLEAVLEQLDATALWTADGEALFESLRAIRSEFLEVLR